MAITFVAASKANYTTGGSVTCPKPTGTAQNDVLYALIYVDNNPTVTPTDSWTLIDSENQTNAPYVQKTYYRVAGASEPASYVFSTSLAGIDAHIMAFRGCDTSSPLDTIHRTAQANGSTPSTTTFTPSVNGCVVIVGAINFGGAAQTPPAGYTEGTDQDGLEDSYLIQTTATATGALATTGGSGAQTVQACAFRPPGAAAAVGVGLDTVASLVYTPPVKPVVHPAPFAFPLAHVAAIAPGSIVSGSATFISNSVIAESAQIIEPATIQSNSVVVESAQVVEGTTEQSNSVVLDAPAQLVVPATIQSNSLIVESARIVESTTEQANALINSTTQQVVAPATFISNSILIATGGIAGQGGGTLIANAALAETAAQLLATAQQVGNAAVAETAARILATATAQANAVLAVTGSLIGAGATNYPQPIGALASVNTPTASASATQPGASVASNTPTATKG
jgi:carbonic anhydrase/acetyltransferase-like protein (isoleucine patch superfamily)